ncbi:MAG: EutN/CcmL family microcompartment protein [Candidatus Eisenbacteria bacterium]|uniref:EutN/CcmL family microcompartment protein n=1 Tax=Eiseniibacteriota bacterium TaxID=2212470 RepID=A0A7Y2EGU2_UNCEI|nr:EutN/CcmL family microcompartment protein [Candidatus Eisenbacteria bacterium]
MFIARVVGTVVATRKAESLVGHKFLLLRQVNGEGKDTANYVVATDAVGAGEGDVVLYASGSSARQTQITHEKPCDAVVMAIIDSWEVGPKRIYDKSKA